MVMYNHKPLENDSIRILTLLHGTGYDEIRCRMKQRSNEKYEALSWCWGTTQEEATIKILGDSPASDATMLIKPNLASALRRLRHPENDRFLWIDAICIDQNNKHERNAQVAMMSRIYEDAEKVDVWLGEEEDDSEMALDFIKNEISNLDRFDELVEDGPTDKWKALTALLTREWFERRWVVQEIALGKSAELYCGKGSVLWTDFTIAVALFESRSKSLSKLYKASPSHDYNPNFLGDVEALGATRLVHVISNLLRRSDTGQISERRLNLEQLVANLATFQAREPHDMIYAVLALAKDTHKRTKAGDGDMGISRANTEVASVLAGNNATSIFDRDVAKTDERKTQREMHIPGQFEHSPQRSGDDEIRKVQSAGPETPMSAGGRKRQPKPTEKPVNLGFLSRIWRIIAPPPQASGTAQGKITIPNDQERQARPRVAGNNTGTVTRQGFQKEIPNTTAEAANRGTEEFTIREKKLAQTVVNVLQQKRLSTNVHRVFNVDYDQPFFNVCKQFLDFTLPQTGDLDIICRPWAPEDGKYMPLPSWIPTLSGAPFGKRKNKAAAGGFKMMRKNADPLVGPSGFGTRYYNASAVPAHKDSWKLGVEGTETERSLYVTGFWLDDIESLGPASQMGNLPRQWMDDNTGKWSHKTDPSEELWRTLVADRGPNGQNCPEYYPRACAHARGQSTEGEGINTTEFITHGHCSILAEFMERVHCVVWNRRLIRSRNLKALGLVPDAAEKTDQIFILHGCSVPVVLREIEGYYEFVGECYLHGMMDGQATTLNREIIKYIELR